MKCPKCNYTTFDHYDFCPNCNKDLSDDKKFLNIITFELSDKNNYLIETKTSSPPIEEVAKPKDTPEKTLEQPKTEVSQPPTEPQSEKAVKEKDEELSIENLLEDNKETEEVAGDTVDIEPPTIETTQVSSDDDELSLEDIDLGDILETNKED